MAKKNWMWSNETRRTWTSAWRKLKSWQQTGQKGVNIWPNACNRMLDELKSEVNYSRYYCTQAYYIPSHSNALKIKFDIKS